VAKDNGNYVVNESYLTDFANQKLQKFITDSASSEPINALNEFATGAGGGTFAGNYSRVAAGNGGKFAEAQNVQDHFRSYAAAVMATIRGGGGMVTEMTKIQADLRAVKAVLKEGEDSATELSGSALMSDLQDILGGPVSVKPPVIK
jgi:hypothetical protein